MTTAIAGQIRSSTIFGLGVPVAVAPLGTRYFDTTTATYTEYVSNGTAWVALAGANNGVGGVAAGYKIARGQMITATASDTIVTGLATVVSAVANLEDAPVLTCDRAQAVIGDQAGTPAAGSIFIKTYMPTGAALTAPIAATTFVKKVNWIAIGT